MLVSSFSSSYTYDDNAAVGGMGIIERNFVWLRGLIFFSVNKKISSCWNDLFFVTLRQSFIELVRYQYIQSVLISDKRPISSKEINWLKSSINEIKNSTLIQSFKFFRNKHCKYNGNPCTEPREAGLELSDRIKISEFFGTKLNVPNLRVKRINSANFGCAVHRITTLY